MARTDGRIYYFVYQEKLEAFIQGVLDARGGVTLAWVTLAAGAAPVLGPELFALYSRAEAWAAAWVTSHKAGIWLAAQWAFVYESGSALYNLGNKIYDQGLVGFLRNMDPREVGTLPALSNLCSNLLDIVNPLFVIQSWVASRRARCDGIG